MTWAAIRREIAQMLNTPSGGIPATISGLKVVNLVDNPSFENDIVGASSATVTLAQSNEAARFGTYSLKCTYSASGSERVTFKLRSGDRFPVTAGRLYTFSLDYRVASGTSGTAHADIAWFDAGAAELSKVFGTGYAAELGTVFGVSSTDWTRNYISGIAPTGAVTAELRFEENLLLAAGEVVYLDGLMFIEADNLGYIDGTQPGCYWTNLGAPHASSSFRPIVRVYLSPPATIQDTPCAIIIPPAIEVQRNPAGWRKDIYTVRIRVLAANEKQADAAELVDAFRDRLMAAVDGAVRLQNSATVILEQRFEEGAGFQYPLNTGPIYPGFDCLLTIRDDSDVTFTP